MQRPGGLCRGLRMTGQPIVWGDPGAVFISLETPSLLNPVLLLRPHTSSTYSLVCLSSSPPQHLFSCTFSVCFPCLDCPVLLTSSPPSSLLGRIPSCYFEPYGQAPQLAQDGTLLTLFVYFFLCGKLHFWGAAITVLKNKKKKRRVAQSVSVG